MNESLLDARIAGSSPRGIRCRLGRHAWRYVKPQWQDAFGGNGKVGWNYVCERCGKTAWFNGLVPGVKVRP